MWKEHELKVNWVEVGPRNLLGREDESLTQDRVGRGRGRD